MNLSKGLEVRSKIPMVDEEGQPELGLDGKQKILILPAKIETIAVDQGTGEPVVTLKFSSGKTFTIEGKQSIREKIYVPDLHYVDAIDI